jgi:hypothetical protein
MRDSAAVLLPAQVAHNPTAFNATRFGQFIPEDWDYKPSYFLASSPATELPLKFVDWNVFRSMFIVGTHDAAPPQYWSVAPNGYLNIGPTPDDIYTYRFDYQKSPQELAADGDTPEMPSKFHSIIAWKALMLMSAADADSSLYTTAYGQYEDLESELILDQGAQIETRFIPMA